MRIDWESKNMAWGYFIQLSRESFYFCVTLAGIDIEFHIHNVRSVIYEKEQEKESRFSPTEEGQSRCLSCGYEPEELEGLYRGYGCPACESPLVVQISEFTPKGERG